MANKRKLKKQINDICSELFADCMAASISGGAQKEQDIHDLLTSILILHGSCICRISHPQPGMTPHAYFADLKTQLAKQAEEIADQIANL